MTQHPRISISQQVEQVVVKRGETITVVLAVYGDDGNYNYVNVELRVLEDGTREIFCDDLHCKPYSEWKAIP